MSLRSEVIRIMNELLGASKKISELPAASPLSGAELMEAVQNGANVQVSVSSLGSGGGVAYWRGAYDLSVTNDYPTTGGTGAAGIPAPGNEWYVSVAGDLDINGLGVTPVEYGALLKYLGGAVGSPSSWKVTQ